MQDQNHVSHNVHILSAMLAYYLAGIQTVNVLYSKGITTFLIRKITNILTYIMSKRTECNKIRFFRVPATFKDGRRKG